MDQLQEMLHVTKSDDVSVQTRVRLGKYDASRQTPRPVKVVFASEQQKNKVLPQAENLQGNRVFEKVYIQQDLTVKHRKKRRELVQQLVQRKAQGEVNLMIVRDQIVVRRQRQEARTQPETAN